MRRSISTLSETWFEIAKKVNAVFFSFIFFWTTLYFLPHITKMITHYLEHLGNTTGNTGYYTLETIVKGLSIILYVVFGLAPFVITGITLNIINIHKKK